jgi:Fe-S-cluster containining protein
MNPNAHDDWYQDGLRFTCTQCGKCCTGAPGFVWVNQEEITQLSQAMKMRPEEFVTQYTRMVGIRRSLIEKPNYDCIFYDSQVGCTVYEARPRQCRTWPFWESNLQTPERWNETCEVCPGSGVGKLFTIEEINKQKSVMRI